jgi:hypothetical protein
MTPVAMARFTRGLRAATVASLVVTTLLIAPASGQASPTAPVPQDASAPPAASATLSTGERVELLPNGASSPSFRVTPATPGGQVGGYTFGTAGGTLRVQPSGRGGPVRSTDLALGRATEAPKAAADPKAAVPKAAVPKAAAASARVTLTVPALPGAEQKVVMVWNRTGWIYHPTDSAPYTRVATADLPPGDYFSVALISSWQQPGHLLVTTFTVAAAPLKVTFPSGVVETGITVDDATARRSATAMWISLPNGDLAGYAGGDDGGKLYVTPFSVPGATLRLREILVKAGHQASSPYRYDLFQEFPNTAAAKPLITVPTATLARTITSFRAQGLSVSGSLTTTPQIQDSGGAALSTPISLPSTITEYVTPGRPFSRSVSVGSWEYVFALKPRTLQVGANPAETVGAGPVHPNVSGAALTTRDYDLFDFREYPTFGDAAGNTGVDRRAVMSARLTSGGRTLWSVTGGSPSVPMTVAVVKAPATYEFEQTVDRRVPWSRLATKVQSRWVFVSGRAGRQSKVPLLDIGLSSTGLDAWNAAGSAPVTVTASATRRDNAGTVTLTGLSYSTDDGATWTALPLTGSGSSASGSVPVPTSAAFVSLRVTAADGDGGSLDRAIIRAFGGPASQGDESAGATTVGTVTVNGGEPVVFGTPDTYAGTGTIAATFTVTDPAGVNGAVVTAYHGTYARRDATIAGETACGRINANGVATCTTTLLLDTRFGPERNVLAGPWKVHVIGRSADGTGFADVQAAGAFSLLRQTKLTVDATPEPVTTGSTVTVTGTLTQSNWESRAFAGWSGQAVQLQFRRTGATTYTVVKTIESGARGALKTTVKATVDGAYRYVFAGSAQFAAGASSADAIDVR